MKSLLLLGSLLVLAASCKKYETCATYSDSKMIKYKLEDLKQGNKADI